MFFNVVICNLTRLTTKSSWYFQSAVFLWYYMLRALRHCASVFERGGLFSVLILVLSSLLLSSGLSVNVFLPPPPPPNSRYPLLTRCDRCLEDCVGAHGWVVGIASHGSIILSRGQLVTVEAPGFLKHPSSIQPMQLLNKHLGTYWYSIFYT